MSVGPPLSRGGSYSPTEGEEITALQLACRKGSVEQVRYLLESGCELDVGPDTALHIALRKRRTTIALMLLQAGADFEVKDSHGDCAIHIAAALGLLDVVVMLCNLGCSVEVTNSRGFYPLHLAARNGHTHVVRCLCAAGCNIDVRNADNIRADITALKYGHNDIAELLDRLRASGQRDTYARQLVPTTKPAVRLAVRLLGHCGVGKSSVVKSLSAGLFSSLFRRSSSLQSNKSRPSSPINTQIEMDVTSRQNSLTFETGANYQSTKGVNLQHLDISNVGEVSVWEFSGAESYFPLYHHFLWPTPNCLTLVLFNLDDPLSTQIQQVCFWLNFLMARQPADLPPAEYGKIAVVATHVDTTRAGRSSNGEWICPDAQRILDAVRKIVPPVHGLIPSVIVMDCNVPASYAFKQIKAILTSMKQEGIQSQDKVRSKNNTQYDLIADPCVKQSVGTWTGLLEASLTWLNNLRKEMEQFPVLTKNAFYEQLRLQVNLLTSDDHISELLCQLHLMAEAFCVGDLVVVSVQWLCTQLLGELLSAQLIGHARVTGVYTSDDFQASFNHCDALGVLSLLEALQLCIQCEVDGEVEYEFPIYNQTETLPGLWDSADPRYRVTGACYGGVRLCTPPGTCHLFTSVFPHVQVNLRRATSQYSSADSDTDLYQWYQGSKLCSGALESHISIYEGETEAQSVEIKVRGPRETSVECFHFMDQIVQAIEQSIACICPGLLVERHVLSAQQLRVHSNQVYCFSPEVVAGAMLEAESTLDVALMNPDIEKQETIVQLILFGNEELSKQIQWGCALRVCDLPASAKLRLCGLLDPPEPHGKDWCLLGLKLGLSQERIAAVDSAHSSHTMRLLTMADCTIGALVSSLHDLGRLDAAEVVLRSAPLFQVVQQDSE